jgi:hypothetical protein
MCNFFDRNGKPLPGIYILTLLPTDKINEMCAFREGPVCRVYIPKTDGRKDPQTAVPMRLPFRVIPPLSWPSQIVEIFWPNLACLCP